MKAKLRELVQEFRTVFAGRSNLTDSVIPPIVFLIANPLLGLNYAVWGSLLISLLVCLYRLAKRQSLKYALGGLGGVVLAEWSWPFLLSACSTERKRIPCLESSRAY